MAINVNARVDILLTCRKHLDDGIIPIGVELLGTYNYSVSSPSSQCFGLLDKSLFHYNHLVDTREDGLLVQSVSPTR